MGDWESPVTVFVGNIEDTLPDSFIISILQQFGKVLSWKRAKNEKDRTLDFGFADFSSPKGALKALRIAPCITILGKTWIVRTDKRIEADLQNYNSSRALNPAYKAILQQEMSDDQKTLKNINDQISSASFAKAATKIHGVIFSEFDEERESEHFRYLSDIRKENEELEILFKDQLLQQRSIEAQKETERRVMNKEIKETEERAGRRSFLDNWEEPELESLDNESIQEFSLKWTQFLEAKKERRERREKEIEQENRL